MAIVLEGNLHGHFFWLGYCDDLQPNEKEEGM